MATEQWAIALVAGSSVLAAFAPILLKKGAMQKFDSISSILKNKSLYAGALLYALGIGTFVFALQHGDLSVLYPISSLGYIWACLGSIKFLGEKMNAMKWLGIAAIIMGVTLIGASN